MALEAFEEVLKQKINAKLQILKHRCHFCPNLAFVYSTTMIELFLVNRKWNRVDYNATHSIQGIFNEMPRHMSFRRLGLRRCR